MWISFIFNYFIFSGGFILKNCNIFTDDLMKRTSLCYREMSPAYLCAEYVLLKML